MIGLVLKVRRLGSDIRDVVLGSFSRQRSKGREGVDYVSLIVGAFMGAWATNVMDKDCHPIYAIILLLVVICSAVLMTRWVPPGGSFRIPEFGAFLPAVKQVYPVLGCALIVVADGMFNEPSRFSWVDVTTLLIIISPLSLLES